MLNFKRIFLAGSLLSAIVMAVPASAAPVQCPTNGQIAGSGGTLNRFVIVDPALVGGDCYYQTGNLSGNPDQGAIEPGAVLIEINDVPDGGGTDAVGVLTWDTGSFAGTFGLDATLWSSFERIWVGFHFGNGQGEPDFFAVELEAFQTGGAFSLNLVPGGGGGLNGLSNIRLAGILCPPNEPQCNEDERDVPEPGTLALIGLGALGLALRRRVVA